MTFCYWEVFNDSNFYISLTIFMFSILLFVYIANQCRKIYSVRLKIEKSLRYIYLYLFLWSIFYPTKHIFGIISYAATLRNDYSNVKMEIYSQAFCVLDSIPTFFLEGLLILIPYLWLKNICRFLGQLNRKSNKTKILIKIISYYNIIRCFIYFCLYSAELIVDRQQLAPLMCQILISYIIFQSLMNLSLFVFGICYLYTQFSTMNMTDQKKRKQFMTQYLFMIFCSIIRLVMDYLFISFSNDQSQTTCIDYRYSNYLYSILYLLTGSTLMHFAPIILILYLYRIDFQYLKKNSSLIDKDSG